MTIQIKATKQYFPAVLFIVLYKVVLTFEFGFLCSVDSRWAEDMILYSTKEFGFISLSDAYR